MSLILHPPSLTYNPNFQILKIHHEIEPTSGPRVPSCGDHNPVRPQSRETTLLLGHNPVELESCEATTLGDHIL